MVNTKKVHLWNPNGKTGYTTFFADTICGRLIDRKRVVDKLFRRRPTCKLCRKEYFKS